ncbi:MAG: haloacid dehalogenase-like hydrolase, partial [Pseudomonadota bacterium]
MPEDARDSGMEAAADAAAGIAPARAPGLAAASGATAASAGAAPDQTSPDQPAPAPLSAASASASAPAIAASAGSDEDASLAPGPSSAAEPPLVIDLDGTLVPVDSLHESALALIARDAGRGLATVFSLLLRHGFRRAPIKAALALRILPDPSKLPYRPAALALAQEARAAGRRVALVTAADRRIAEAVADHLGLFDEVHGSDEDRNLGGEDKAALLCARFGRGGFDYAGDARGGPDRQVAAR